MGLHPGALIGANVRLLAPLSRGGMGSVWRAEHLTLHTEVAVKFVSDALVEDAGFLARFKREAVASARIKSPHAVQIFDHGVTSDSVPYIVMELLEGEDLRTRIAREKKLSLDTTIQIVTQAARGLARSHAASIVHRDIKPGNLFLMEQDGELFLKILDFGIAKRIGDVDQAVTMTGQIIGTPHYVSPEQIQRPRQADPQNDLWSLAVVAYRCLTGELPFEGESVGAVAIAIDKAMYTPITQREPSLPKMLDAWFGRAFARVPSARFGSAKEMSVAFEAAAKDEPLPTSVPESTSLPGAAAVAALSSVARLSPAAPDVTPGAVNLPAPASGDPPATPEERATRPDDRATPPEIQEPAPAAKAAIPAAETPRGGETPLASVPEPTLSQGTVTHIETTHARRTRLYGGAIAVIAIGGAITVGVLSRGDDSQASTGSTAAPPGSAAPVSEAPAGAASAVATGTSQSATAPVASSGAVAAEVPSAAKSAVAAPKTGAAASASAGAGASGKGKKKDRGF